jgi:hypothetical protein
MRRDLVDPIAMLLVAERFLDRRRCRVTSTRFWSWFLQWLLAPVYGIQITLRFEGGIMLDGKLRIAPTCYHTLHIVPIMAAHEMNFLYDEGLKTAD